MVDQITASGDRSIAVGTVINSIINTGDHNRFFIGDYVRLRDAYIEPWPVFERVNLARFVGREWLLAEVDAFLRDHDRGYFVLEAEAGLGKTTFLAWLVKQRGYVHHFVELARGQEGVGIGLKNLGAQLVLNYHLEAWEAEGVLPGAAVRPDYLARLLKLAAEARPAGSQVVLVIDALDEAGTPMGQNVLGLPQVLPEGVYVIASQRPVAVTLQVDTASTPRRIFQLAADNDENQADMRLYLEGAVAWPGIAKALRASGYTAEQFVKTLLEKCRGVWIYLHYVIHEIEQGERSPLDLDGLPDGMTQYYARYWRNWRDADEAMWYESYLPLLAMLAAAREAVSARRLQEWTGVMLALPRLNKLLNERWRPFLAVSDVDGETRYRFYHATLTEFFTGQVERARLSEAETAMVNELAEATRAAHGRLADRYLEAWGGLAGELPGLKDEPGRELDDGYGARHLAGHLEGGERWEELHALVAEGSAEEQMWAAAKLRVDGHYAGYLADVEMAWAQARKKVEESTSEKAQEAALVRWLRYALVVTSINSLAGNYDPTLVRWAIKSERLTAQKALALAARVPEATKRTALYQAILTADGLTKEERRKAEEDWLAAIRAIEDDQARALAVVALAPQMTDDLVIEGLAAAKSIRAESYRAWGLAALAPRLTGELLAQGLAVARVIIDDQARVLALAALAPLLTDDLVIEGLAAASSFSAESYRAWGLAALAPRLTGELLAQGLALARVIIDDQARALALAALAPQLTGALVIEAMAAIQTIGHQGSRAVALAAIAPLLTGEAQAETLATVPVFADECYLARELVASQQTPKERLARSMELPFVGLDSTLPWRKPRSLTEKLAAAFEFQPRPDLFQLSRSTYGLPSDPGNLTVFGQSLDTRYFYPRDFALVESTPPENFETSAVKLAETLQFAYDWFDSFSLADLAADQDVHFEPDQARAGMEAQEVLEELCRAYVLTVLIPQLKFQGREQALAMGLEAMRTAHVERGKAKLDLDFTFPIDFPKTQTTDVERSKVKLPWGFDRRLLRDEPLEAGLTAGLVMVRALGSEQYRAHALAALATILTGEPPAQTAAGRLTAAQSIGDDESHAEALAATQVIGDKESRVHALMTLASQLAGETREQALAEALAAAQVIGNEVHRRRALVALAPQLTSELVPHALAATRVIISEWDRLCVLQALAPKLSTEELLVQGLALALEIDDRGFRAEALAALAPQLKGAAREQALAQVLIAARTTRHDGPRVRALTALAPHLKGVERDQVLATALAEAKNMRDDNSRALALAALASQFRGKAREEALAAGLAAAKAISHEEYRARALATLASQLEGEVREQALAEALAATHAIGDDETRAQVLEVLAPWLTREQRAQELAAAQAINHLGHRVKALATLAPHLTAAEQKQVQSLIREAMANHLWYLQKRSREQVLKFCSEKQVFAPPILNTDALGDMLRAIMEVGRWWP